MCVPRGKATSGPSEKRPSASLRRKKPTPPAPMLLDHSPQDWEDSDVCHFDRLVCGAWFTAPARLTLPRKRGLR